MPPAGATDDPQGREDDGELTAAMAAAQAGDRSAYDRLLRESIPIIRRIARHRGVPAEYLDDVVQDVLITIHGARQTFDPNRSFVAWLTTIAQRRTIDLLRKRGRRVARETYAPLAYEVFASADDPAREAEQSEEARHLRTLVAGLPEGQRQAIETLGLEETSLEDASKSTGRTKTALKVNLHRAIATLRERMGGRKGP